MVTKIYDGSSKPPLNNSPEDEARLKGLRTAETSLERFARSFEVSARRWELVVYPSLFAFILLAGYGFFLIYSLTQDMHILARSMDPQMSPHMEQMADHIAVLSVSIQLMGEEIEKMGGNVDDMAHEVGMMSTKMNALEPMLVNISEMNKAMHTMALNTGTMTTNTGYMTREIGQMGRPMNMMNSFFPW
jgi:hypothetical protein